jgi:UDP-glucose 4-epimerase
MVVHLASITDYMPGWGEYIRNNAGELADFLERCGSVVKKFFLFSSQSVYGAMPKPYRVSDAKLKPVNHYGVSKYLQEEVAQAFVQGKLFIVRPAVVIGPGQCGRSLYAGLIKNTVARVKAGLPPMIYGDGSRRHGFVSVHSLSRYVYYALTGTRLPAVMNATSSEGPISVLEVVRRIQEIMESYIEPIVGQFKRTADKNGDDYAYCDNPGLFPPAINGPVLREHVESLVAQDLPSREEILALDIEQERQGVIQRR